mmetsp:Transcript_8828/g.12408  ORF Transcript_8828/g.12408 Transcript_8828/m.12408 type:complete len:88 (+) Transcript_8828:230-493(+)
MIFGVNLCMSCSTASSRRRRCTDWLSTCLRELTRESKVSSAPEFSPGLDKLGGPAETPPPRSADALRVKLDADMSETWTTQQGPANP